MAKQNRTTIIKNTFKTLKKHYQPVPPVKDRTLLEHLLYACCLENAQPDVAEQAYQAVREAYFDWNEVRVTTATELGEVMNVLPASAAAGRRLKRTLQAVFEEHYSFDLEELKKQTIGKTVKQFEKHQGMTPFVIAYATQHGLGGHAIPVCEGSLKALYAVGAVSDAELAKKQAPGLERAVAKAKGFEFASLLHQAGTELLYAPFSPHIRGILNEIAPDARERLPKRRTKKSGAKSTGKKAKSAAAAKKKPAATAKKKPAKPGGKSTTKRLAKKKPR